MSYDQRLTVGEVDAAIREHLSRLERSSENGLSGRAAVIQALAMLRMAVFVPEVQFPVIPPGNPGVAGEFR